MSLEVWLGVSNTKQRVWYLNFLYREVALLSSVSQATRSRDYKGSLSFLLTWKWHGQGGGWASTCPLRSPCRRERDHTLRKPELLCCRRRVFYFLKQIILAPFFPLRCMRNEILAKVALVLPRAIYYAKDLHASLHPAR